MKIVINNKHGGFGLSDEAVKMYAELAGFDVFIYQPDPNDPTHKYSIKKSGASGSLMSYTIKQDLGDRVHSDVLNKADWFHDRDIERTDPILIQVIEKLGDKANSRFSELKIVEIPDDVKWHIAEYDGLEWVAEDHRTWE